MYYFLKVCECVCVCIHVHEFDFKYPRRQEEGIWAPRPGVTGDC